MFCALLTSRCQVSVYRTNGPLVWSSIYCYQEHGVKIFLDLFKLQTISGNVFYNV